MVTFNRIHCKVAVITYQSRIKLINLNVVYFLTSKLISLKKVSERLNLSLNLALKRLSINIPWNDVLKLSCIYNLAKISWHWLYPCVSIHNTSRVAILAGKLEKLENGWSFWTFAETGFYMHFHTSAGTGEPCFSHFFEKY